MSCFTWRRVDASPSLLQSSPGMFYAFYSSGYWFLTVLSPRGCCTGRNLIIYGNDSQTHSTTSVTETGRQWLQWLSDRNSDNDSRSNDDGHTTVMTMAATTTVITWGEQATRIGTATRWLRRRRGDHEATTTTMAMARRRGGTTMTTGRRWRWWHQVSCVA